MSDSTRGDEAAKSGQVNGKAAAYSRIADLLDDVTVGGAAGATVPRTPAAHEVLATPILALPLPAAEPLPTSPIAPPAPPQATQAPEMPARMDPASAPVPSPLQPAAPQRTSRVVSGLPGEPVVAGAQRTALPAASFSSGADAPSAVPNKSEPEANATAAVVSTLSPSDMTAPSGDGIQAAPSPLFNIKGRSDGIAVEIGKGNWHEILGALADRLDASGRFFRQGSVALDAGPRPVTEAELQQLADVLTTHEMTLGLVRTSSEPTFQAALALGFTVSLESAEGVSMAAAAPAITNTDGASYFVYRGYLRSGHRLWRKENILVLGDINPGAEVISEGDILVWGRLRGIVQAGAGGNKRAIVAALDLEPTQLRIADAVTLGPDPKSGQPGRFFWRRSQHKRPEIARIVDESIILEEWDTARPGGLVSLRRGSG